MGESRGPPLRRSPTRAARCALRSALACACACAAAIAAPSTAVAGDVSAEAEIGAGRDDRPPTSRDYLRQTYQLRYTHQVSTPIGYNLGLLYQDDRGNHSGPVSGRDRSRQFAPSAHFNWRIDGFSLVLSSALTEGSAVDPLTNRSVSRSIQRYGGTSRLRLMQNAELIASGSRLAFSGAGVDTTRDTAGLGFDWKLGPMQILNMNRVDRYEDEATGLTRTVLGPTLSAQYAQAGPRWTLGARYDFDYARTEQRALTLGSVSVPSDVPPVAGLYAVDDLPADTSMSSESRLIDGNLNASAGVDVGPTGASFQNVGLDMGRALALDELRVHVRNSSGQPLTFPGPVDWTVWASQDGIAWALVPGQTQTFSVVMSAYILEFTATTARFFKAVSFRVNTVETLVTEIQPFVEQQQVAAGETLVAHGVRQGVNLDVGANLAPKAYLSYVGQAHSSSTTGFEGRARYAGDTTSIGAVRLGPFGAYRFDVAATQYYTRSGGGSDQSKFALSATTRYQPIERFTAAFEGYRALERIGAVRSTTTGATLSSSATVYDALIAGASLGLSRQALETGDSADYLTGSGSAVAQVRRDLELRLDVSAQRTVSEQGNPGQALASTPGLQRLVFHRYYAEARYRPSYQLDLLGRVGYAATPVGDGILRKLRVNWEPFPGGNVRLSFDYDVEFDALSGRSYQQISAAPQWLVNRHATLSLRYNDIRGSGATAIDQQSVNLSLSVML
jgi:hypothetical protein